MPRAPEFPEKKRQVSYLVKCGVQVGFELPRIAALAPVAARIGPELRKMGNVRNDLVHGGVLGFSPGPPARLHLRKYACQKEQATATILTPTGADLAEFTRIVAEVRTVLTRLSVLMLQQG